MDQESLTCNPQLLSESGIDCALVRQCGLSSVECFVGKRRSASARSANYLHNFKQKNPPYQSGAWLSFNRRADGLVHGGRETEKIQNGGGEAI